VSTELVVERRPSLRWLLPAVWWYVGLRGTALVALAVVDPFVHKGLLNKLTRWDAAWYLAAAEHGYPSQLPMVDGHVAANPIAFFPLLPLCIRALHAVTFLPYSVSGVLITLASGLTAVLAVGLLVAEFRPTPDALRAAIVVCVFPGTFVFSMIYAEGLIVTFVALSLRAALRGRWVVAGLLGALATLASPAALALCAALGVAAVVAVVRQRWWSALAAPVLSPLGALAYLAYLQVHTGSWQAWRRTEEGGWHSYPSLRYPLHVLDVFFSNPLRAYKTIDLLIAGMVVVGLGLYWAFRQHQPLVVLAYAVASVVLITISRPVSVRPRFILLAFPVVVAWALRFEGRGARVLVGISVAAWAALSAFEFYSWAVFP
jgi:Mannosyltransferase (PIG-V)